MRSYFLAQGTLLYYTTPNVGVGGPVGVGLEVGVGKG